MQGIATHQQVGGKERNISRFDKRGKMTLCGLNRKPGFASQNVKANAGG